MKPQAIPATPLRGEIASSSEAAAAPHSGRASVSMRIALAAAIAALAAWALPAQALVLGAASVRSSLGQPLLAEVRILDGDDASLAAALASRALYQRHGISSPQHALGRIDVRVVESAGGRVIRMTSERPVREPILQLLLEASDQRGHIVRELALLLDPPTTALAEAATPPRAATRQARAGQASAPAGDLLASGAERPTTTTATATARARPAGARARSAATGKAQARPARSRVRSRPAVRTASTRTPDRQATRPALARAAAAAPLPRTAPAPAVAAPAAATPLTQQAAEGITAPVAGTSLPDLSPEMPATEAPGQAAAAHDVGIEAVVGIGAAAAATQESAAPAPAAPVGAASARSGPSLGDYTLAAGALALLASLLALRVRRRRSQGRAAEASDSELVLDESDDSLNFGAAFGASGADGMGARAAAAAPVRHDRVPHDGMVALEADDEVDPLAEAEVYVAYGRTHQARAILEDALHHHPQRAALHLKLMSIHRDQRDALAFKERARALALLTGQHGPEWREACEMGQDLIPGDTLFIASEPLPLSEESAGESRPVASGSAWVADSEDWPQPGQPVPEPQPSGRASEQTGERGQIASGHPHAAIRGPKALLHAPKAHWSGRPQEASGVNLQAANEPPAVASLCDTDPGTLGLGTGPHWPASDSVVAADGRPDLELFGADDYEGMAPGIDPPEAPAPAGAAFADDVR